MHVGVVRVLSRKIARHEIIIRIAKLITLIIIMIIIVAIMYVACSIIIFILCIAIIIINVFTLEDMHGGCL